MTVTIRNPFVAHDRARRSKRPPKPTRYRYTLTPMDDLFASPPEDERTSESADRRIGLLAVSLAIGVVLAAVTGLAIVLVQLIHAIYTYFA